MLSWMDCSLSQNHRTRTYWLASKKGWRTIASKAWFLQSPHCSSLVCSLLVDVLGVLKANTSKGMFNRIVHRRSGLDELEKYNRLIDDYNTNFLVCSSISFGRCLH